MLAAEIVESAHGHHPHGHTGTQGGCGHRVDGAISTRRHQQTSVIAGGLCCVIRQLNDVTPLTRYVPHHGMVVLGKCTTQLCAHQIQIGPWPQWNHHMDGTVVMKDHGTVQIGHGDEKRGGRNDACEAKDPTRGRYSMITAQWLQRSQRRRLGASACAYRQHCASQR